MDGKYLNNEKQNIQFLKDWMEKVKIQSNGKDFFDDYYINEIDLIFENKSSWLSGAINLFGLFKRNRI